MSKTKRTLFVICLLFAVVFVLWTCADPGKEIRIDVSDHGIEANTKQNLTAKINQLIEGLENDAVTLVFPKGRYDFYPDSSYFRPYFETNTYDVNPKRLAILLDRKKNLTIDAQGSDFVYHGHIQPFTLDNSEDICIKNVNIDWDKPLTAESEVIEADSTHILIKIDTVQFPYLVHENGLTFQDADWKENWALSGGSWLIEIGKDHIIPAFTGAQGCVNGDLKNVRYSEPSRGLVLMEGEFSKTPSVGNFLIMRHSTRDHAGMFLFHSKNIKLENVNVYHTSGLGILSQYCENIEMQNVNMIPNPHKNRYLSGHDDGLHFMGCKGEIIINECDAQGLMDDPINIHGTYVPVAEKITDNSIVCNYAHSMSMGLIWAQEGDSIGFVEKKNMRTIAYGTLAEFEILDEKSFLLKFHSPVPEELSPEYSVENLSWTPNATITNCYVGSNRARGYLISTPGKVLIENNIFETSGSAILIAGDANYWYESGPVKDILIRNNEFRTACNSSSYQFCNAVISIYPEIPDPDPMLPYHKNIRIENNRFNPSDFPLIYAVSVDGLNFTGNSVSRSYAYEPWHFQKYTFLFDACKNVNISGNEFGKDVLGKNILLKRMTTHDLHNDHEELVVEVNSLKSTQD